MSYKTININSEDINITKFPDGQLHVNIARTGIEEGDDVRVIAAIRNPSELYVLMSVANAISQVNGIAKELFIPYLMGARSDRSMMPGDCVDIEVIAECINRCNFEKVVLFDVHSNVSTSRINESINLDNRVLIDEYCASVIAYSGAVLICPDNGAKHRTESVMKRRGDTFKEIIYVNKKRDPSNGELTIVVSEEDRKKCYDKICVIADDLCDGGGTFIGIATQIEPRDLTLIVSHGVFSKGVWNLLKFFDRIITTETYQRAPISDVKFKALQIEEIFYEDNAVSTN